MKTRSAALVILLSVVLSFECVYPTGVSGRTLAFRRSESPVWIAV